MLGRSVRTSQPQGPARVDWSNPICRGLVSSFLPGLSPVDLISGVVSTYEGGGRATSITQAGVSAKTSPTRIKTNALPQFTGDLSFVWLGSVNVFATGVTGQLFNQRNTYSDGGLTISLGVFSTSDIQFNAKSGPNGALAITTSSIGYGLNQTRPIAGRVAGTSQQLFTDGILRSSRTNSVTLANQTIPVYIGALSNGNEALDANHLCLHIWNRALSDAEIKSISDNPWQIFAPDSKALWIPASATVSLPTLVQPSSTTSAGAWTATGAATLHDAINELVPSDTQYISVNSASTTELVLAESAHPGAANQTLAYRASSTQGSTLTVTLKQGATQIMTRTHALTGTDTLYTQTLSAPEIALITSGAISVTLTTS